MQRWARSAWGQGMLLGLTFLAVIGPWMKHATAQPASRMALTAAVADQGTIEVDRYEHVLGVDRVERGGHVYSDKAPGQPFYAVPFYAVARAAGADPVEELGFEGSMAQWWVTLWSSTVPGALIVVMVFWVMRRSHPRGALPAATSVGFGTLILPFSAELYGHVMATALAFAAWLVVRSGRTNRWWMLLTGALIGASVVVEYQMALLALVILAVVARRRLSDVAWAVLGGIPFALLLATYQAAAFGGPLRTSYGEKPGGSNSLPGWPDPIQAIEVLLGSRGLLLFAPVALFGLVGLVLMLRERRGSVSWMDGLVGLVVFALYLGLQSGWTNPWGGEMPGPRYMIPALPFLAPGVASLWHRAEVLGRIALTLSILAMAFPLVTLHLVPAGGETVISHLRNIDQFGISQTVWTSVLGDAGWLVHLLTVVGCIALLQSWRERPPSGPRPPLHRDVAPGQGAS